MIRDREMVIDALQSCKVDTVSFTQAAIETSDPNLKQTLKQIRDQVENSHDQAFQIASQHGWYEYPAPANPQEVQRLKNRFSTVGGPVGVGQWGAGAYGVSQQPGVSGQFGQYSGQQFHPSHFGPQSGQQYSPGQYGAGSYGTSGTPQSTLMSQPTGQAGQSGRNYGQQYPGSGSHYGPSQYSPGQYGAGSYGTSGTPQSALMSQPTGQAGQSGRNYGQQYPGSGSYYSPSQYSPSQYSTGQYGAGSYGTSGTPQSTLMSQPTGQAGQSGRNYGQQYPGSGSQMGTTSQYGGGQFGQQYPGSGFQQSWNPASPQSGGTYSPGRTSI